MENAKLKLKYSMGIAYLEVPESSLEFKKLNWLVINEKNVISCQMIYEDGKAVEKCYQKKY